MSVIIRLQNLPWSANSSDIRHFFRGLEIPEGGVHIIGGDNGDAFIAFRSDEDGRIAMQKDGLRLKGNYVKLILSSRPEMQQIIDEIRDVHEHGKPPEYLEERPKSGRRSPRMRSPERGSGNRNRRSSLKRSWQSRSPSPRRNPEPRFDASSYSDTRHRSSSSNHKDVSEGKRTRYKEPSRTDHIREYDHGSPHREAHTPDVKFVDASNLYDRRSPLPAKELHAHHTTAKPDAFHNREPFHVMPSDFHERPNDPVFDPPPFIDEYSKFRNESFEHHGSHQPIPKPALALNEWANEKFQTDIPCWLPEPNLPFPEKAFDRTNKLNHDFNAGSLTGVPFPPGPRRLQNYCVQLSGFQPTANFKDIQAALKKVYAPQRNIKWDVNKRGHKSGTAYVRLSNIEDFNKVLSTQEIAYEGSTIHVSRCPDDIFYYMFERNSFRQNPNEEPKDFCYMLKGLPYATTEEDVVHFFTGLNLVDLLILYDKDGKATGTGFIQFSSLADYNLAFERNGKKIGHRYIELVEANREDMDDARSTAVAVSKPIDEILNEQMYRNRSESYKQNALQKRPLCVVLGGLPPDITASGIFSFFKECGVRPDAVHIVLNERNRNPSGRAFAEFLDLFDLDVALKQHAKFMGSYMVSVKQVLFEEMMRILDTHLVVHDFGIALKKAESSGPLPEKLPYIWEPPDEDIKQSAPTRMFSQMNNLKSPPSRFKPQFHDDLRPNQVNPVRSGNFNMNDAFDRPKQLAFGSDNYRNRSDQDNNLRARNRFPRNSERLDDFNVFGGRPMDSFSPNWDRQMSPPRERSDGRNFPRGNLNRREGALDMQGPGDSSFHNENWISSGDRTGSSDVFFGQDVSFPNDRSYFQQGGDNFGHGEFGKSLRGRQEEYPNTGMGHSNRPWNKGQDISERPYAQKPSFQKNKDGKGNQDTNRVPVKFGVKSRQAVSTSEKMKDTFDPNSDKDTEKRKLKKLSPERPPAKEDRAKRSSTQEEKQKANERDKRRMSGARGKDKETASVSDSKGAQQKQDESKKSSSSQKSSKPDKGALPNPDKSKGGQKRPADVSSKDNYRNKRRNVSTDKQSDSNTQPQRNASHRSRRDQYLDSRARDTKNMVPDNMQPYHPDARNRFEDSSAYESSTVQVSGVPPYCGVGDLLHFFRGFDILSENIIRRYTDTGEPTGDVRVTLINGMEAKRAAKLLNMGLIGEVPVEVFCV